MNQTPLKCKIADCEEPRKTRGLCSMHYQRWMRNGDPLRLLRPPAPEWEPGMDFVPSFRAS